MMVVPDKYSCAVVRLFFNYFQRPMKEKLKQSQGFAPLCVKDMWHMTNNIKTIVLFFLDSFQNHDHKLLRTQSDHKLSWPLFGNDDFQGITHCTVTMGTETNLFTSPLLFFFSQRYYCEKKPQKTTTKIQWITLLTRCIASDSLSVARRWLPPAPPAMSLRWVHSIRNGRMG